MLLLQQGALLVRELLRAFVIPLNVVEVRLLTLRDLCELILLNLPPLGAIASRRHLRLELRQRCCC